jgi:hypothetical protein
MAKPVQPPTDEEATLAELASLGELLSSTHTGSTSASAKKEPAAKPAAKRSSGAKGKAKAVAVKVKKKESESSDRNLSICYVGYV